ncbi:MAG: 50S ribosomal protein L22 [Candidatus Marsarchaeota archaeon]|nr:50S ribosomal protein L22 [Candidatus Marsarchaeota archaeon]
MNYSYNGSNKEKVVFAGQKDINASFKDLTEVCTSIRYMKAEKAVDMLDSIIYLNMPIEFKRFNKGMGSRHEIGGKKGRYPKKCAAIIKKTLINAISNAKMKGNDVEDMVVVHASANKTQILMRTPSKGVLFFSDSYGYGTLRRSDIEFSKVEIGLANPSEIKLSDKAKAAIKAQAFKAKSISRASRDVAKPKKAEKAKPAKGHIHPEMDKSTPKQSVKAEQPTPETPVKEEKAKERKEMAKDVQKPSAKAAEGEKKHEHNIGNKQGV